MRRTFTHDQSIEINFGAGRGEDITATVEFTATPVTPATYWQPAEGGEVEVSRVVELSMQQTRTQTGPDGRTTLTISRCTLECPEWLSEMILENVDTDEMFESADFTPEPMEHERD